MNKKKLLITLSSLTIIIFVISLIYLYESKDINVYYDNEFKSNNMLSMMMEQNAGKGDYKIVSQSTWPSEGYIFNSELSRCENGSELIYDEETNKVYMMGNLSDKCYVYFDKIITLSEYVINQYTGVQGENSLYYHDSTLTNGAGDNSYRYAGGDYRLTDAGLATGAISVFSYNSDKINNLIIFSCGNKDTISEYGICVSSKYYYTLRGSATQYSSFSEVLNKALELGYITKDNVNNFVCFGTDADVCPVDNLYRIIGDFNGKVKLIKYDYADENLLGTDGHYSGKIDLMASFYSLNREKVTVFKDPSSYNFTDGFWPESNFNIVNLNTNFLNNIGTKWNNKIATGSWATDGFGYEDLFENDMNYIFNNEVKNKLDYDAKIGLIYISDYGFATDANYWLWGKSSIENLIYLVATNNWLYIGGGSIRERIITNYDDFGGAIYYYGNISVISSSSYVVRPAFYLSSSVYYTSGTGTQTDPIRIK